LIFAGARRQLNVAAPICFRLNSRLMCHAKSGPLPRSGFVLLLRSDFSPLQCLSGNSGAAGGRVRTAFRNVAGGYKSLQLSKLLNTTSRAIADVRLDVLVLRGEPAGDRGGGRDGQTGSEILELGSRQCYHRGW